MCPETPLSPLEGGGGGTPCIWGRPLSGPKIVLYDPLWKSYRYLYEVDSTFFRSSTKIILYDQKHLSRMQNDVCHDQNMFKNHFGHVADVFMGFVSQPLRGYVPIILRSPGGVYLIM